VRVASGGFGPQRVSAATRRGRVRAWARKSRYRLMERGSAALFTAFRYGLVTLTYPKAYQSDPRVSKAQLKAFRKRWERRFGPAQAVWVMEFQRRGAVHWHMVIELTHVDVPDLAEWVAVNWYEVVGSGDGLHLAHGTDVKEAWSAVGARRYLMAELSKYKQKQLPSGMDGAGRWWGMWRTVKREVEIPLSWPEFYRVRRVMRRVGAKVGYRPRESRVGGIMLFDDGVAWGMFVALARWSKAHDPEVDSGPWPAGLTSRRARVGRLRSSC